MEIAESITIMKALSDNSRLMIINSLLEKPQYVEELSERLGLSASTVSFHLKKLEQARLVSKEKEQYYVIYRVNQEIFGTTLGELISFEHDEKELHEQRIQSYKDKVLKTFMQDEQVVKLPSQYKKKMIIVEHIASNFEKGEVYDEADVDEIILKYFDDYCSIRRYMIDEKIMSRKGGKYWLNDSINSKAAISAEIKRPEKSSAGTVKKLKSRKEDKMNRQAELKKLYKETPLPMGIFCVKNLINGKILIGKGLNLDGKLNRYRAMLKFGSCDIPGMQEDYNKYGMDAFSFEYLDRLEPKEDPAYDYRDDLKTLEELWLEKLQPYGDKGYNKPPKNKS